ncbi:ribosome maturation factor RimM [Priestia aryabhattai]|uniref:ribosome maturation factor RimM n=1 Tax=Bacillus sp. CBEL-1 TaxID=2502980 RepID=UPI000BA15903|nr:ribosome maturation factor RimM [Bacillus sp. CBEL-1]OZT11646.1 ribosome maturation factor RimM [Priestia aryabhattai]TDB50495.1 ribosome maturation factor RimM [Bacillus sp. CBEL-1]
MDNWFKVGKIVNTHGIKGEVRIISTTDFAEERYEVGNKLYLFQEKQVEPVEVVVATHRKHKNFDLVSFEGYPNVNDVEKFKNSMIKVSEDQLSELEDGEFYFHEIIGCIVKTDEGQELGKIKEILTPGANDVWVIKGKGGKEILIPYIDEVVQEINIEKKEIMITVMEGLLD